MPDDVVFVSAIPHTATGNIEKTALRDQFKDYVLPHRRRRLVISTSGTTRPGDHRPG